MVKGRKKSTLSFITKHIIEDLGETVFLMEWVYAYLQMELIMKVCSNREKLKILTPTSFSPTVLSSKEPFISQLLKDRAK